MSTSGKTLIAPTSIYNKLIEAEEKAIAALGLLEDVIQPAFEDLRCDGLLGTEEESREIAPSTGWRKILMLYMRPVMRQEI